MAWVHEQPSAVAIDCGCACALRALSAGCTGRRGGLRAGSQWRLGGRSVAVGGIACTRTHPSGPERVSVHVSSRLGAERASECVRMSLSVRVRVRVCACFCCRCAAPVRAGVSCVRNRTSVGVSVYAQRAARIVCSLDERATERAGGRASLCVSE